MTARQATSAPATLRSEILLVFAIIFTVFLLTSAGFDTSEGGVSLCSRPPNLNGGFT